MIRMMLLREMFLLALNIIVAMDRNGLIGVGNNLPWKIPEDLKYFKEVTTNNIVVMGRKTAESIGKSLPNRYNIVLTRDVINKQINYTGRYAITDSLDTISILSNNDEVFIIGGAEIYKQFYPHCDKLYITYVNDTYEGDVYFPIKITQINEDFEIESRKLGKQCEFIVMRRRKL